MVGAAFAATLAPSKAQGSGLQGAASSVAFGILEIGSGRKPLLPKRTMCLGRSGFSRDPYATDDGRFGIVGAASSVALGILKAGVRGESPSYKKIDVVLGRSGFSRDPYVIEDGRLGMGGGGLHPWPWGS